MLGKKENRKKIIPNKTSNKCIVLVTSGTREIGGLLDRVKDEGKKDIVLKRTDFK